MSERDVVIVGAGLSGLVCAYRLKKLGARVLVVETSAQIGGVIRSERIDGYLIERGPNSSQGTEELLALVDELAITDDLVEGDPKSPAFVCFQGHLHPVPSGPGAFVTSKLLTLGGKLRILAEPFMPPHRDAEEESVLSFASRRLGKQVAERLVAPFVSGIYAGDAARLSVEAAFPRLASLETSYGSLVRGMIASAGKTRSAGKKTGDGSGAPRKKRRLISFKEGMAHLPRTLARALGDDVITGSESIRLRRTTPDSAEPAAGRFTVEFVAGGAPGKVTPQQIVIATPAKAAARLVGAFAAELAELLDDIPYSKLSIVHLAYDENGFARPLKGFGFLVVPGQDLDILGCVWSSSIFEGRAPAGKTLLTLFMGGTHHEAIVESPDSELAARAHRDLRRVLGVAAEPQVVAITRYERAIPQYTIGHGARVRRIESLLKSIPGLWLAGNYLHGVSVGDCVKQAEQVAHDTRPGATLAGS